jgi:hypothetical protein
METKKFKHRPFNGAKLKIYLDHKKCVYGYALYITTVLVKTRKGIIEREVVVVDKTETEFSLCDIDFCLEESDVIFDGEKNG